MTKDSKFWSRLKKEFEDLETLPDGREKIMRFRELCIKGAKGLGYCGADDELALKMDGSSHADGRIEAITGMELKGLKNYGLLIS